jgi:hypothetical protein
MDTIECIIGDISDLYEFSSKQIGVLDDKWSGSWVVSDELGSTPVIQGTLIKNETIYNDDNLLNEEIRKTYTLFEPAGNEHVDFNDDVIDTDAGTFTVSGKIWTEGKDDDGNTIEVLLDKYITVVIKGIFSGITRETRVKSVDGLFSIEFNIKNTIKTEPNSFFIFQIMPLESEVLEEKTYILTVEVRQVDDSDKIIFRREVLQSKLKMLKQGLIQA